MMRPLASCPGCLTDKVSPSEPVCGRCVAVEVHAATHEPDCRCSMHDLVARVAKWRRREARRVSRIAREVTL